MINSKANIFIEAYWYVWVCTRDTVCTMYFAANITLHEKTPWNDESEPVS